MISVMAKISVPNSTKINLDGTTNFYKNNISSDISACIGKKYESQNPFILGLSDLSLGAELVDTTIPYFISREICDDSGQFFSPYVMNISSDQEFDSLTFVFDTYNNQHPNTIRIDSQDFIVSSSIVSFSFESSTSHIISISNWNTPNSQLIIQGITSDAELDIDKNSLINIEFSGRDRTDPTTISWGIVSNTGTVSFLDNNKYVETLKKNGDLLGSKIEIYLRNKYRDELIGTFYITDGKTTKSDSTVELNFADKLEDWQQVEILETELISYSEMSITNIMEYAERLQKSGLLNITMYFADQETETRWSKTWVIHPILETSSYWAFLTKCCELTGSYICIDEKGRALIKYDGGT